MVIQLEKLAFPYHAHYSTGEAFKVMSLIFLENM